MVVITQFIFTSLEKIFFYIINLIEFTKLLLYQEIHVNYVYYYPKLQPSYPYSQDLNLYWLNSTGWPGRPITKHRDDFKLQTNGYNSVSVFVNWWCIFRILFETKIKHFWPLLISHAQRTFRFQMVIFKWSRKN